MAAQNNKMKLGSYKGIDVFRHSSLMVSAKPLYTAEGSKIETISLNAESDVDAMKRLVPAIEEALAEKGINWGGVAIGGLTLAALGVGGFFAYQKVLKPRLAKR